jgi:hypothetical protein
LALFASKLNLLKGYKHVKSTGNSWPDKKVTRGSPQYPTKIKALFPGSPAIGLKKYCPFFQRIPIPPYSSLRAFKVSFNILQALIIKRRAKKGMNNGCIGNFSNGGFFVGHSVCLADQFCQWAIRAAGEKLFPIGTMMRSVGIIVTSIGNIMSMKVGFIGVRVGTRR